MKRLIFITGNQNKADFLSKHLGIPIEHQKLDLEEVQSLDIHEVVEHKAREAYDRLKTPVLVEDASLTFPAIGRLPGTFVKWFIEEIGVEGLHRLGMSLSDRTAVGTVCYGLYDGTDIHFFDGEMHGRVAEQPGTGGRGFGFDPIFVNDTFSIPRSDMTEEDYAATSYRTEAMDKLRTFLTK